MPLPASQPFANRRPAGPRCRGGVSSLLRLAQPIAGALGMCIAAPRAGIVTRWRPGSARDTSPSQHSRAGPEPAPYRFPD